MRLNLNTFRRATPLRAFLAAAMLVALGLSVLMASSQSLHELFHKDAASPGHHCVATLLSRQQVLHMESAPLVFKAVLGSYIGPAREVTVSLSSVKYLLFPSRAPPVLS